MGVCSLKPAKIQVILPSFNRPNVVQTTIKSVQAQTCEDWRLYIMDNSSPKLWPRMKEVYSKYACEDERILIDHTHVENSDRRKYVWIGVVTNKALYKLSQKEPYVVVSCDDDYMVHSKLEILSRYLDNHPGADMVSGIMHLIDDNGKTIQTFGGTHIACGSCAIDWMQPMWRRTLLERVGPLFEKVTFRPSGGVLSIDAEMFVKAATLTPYVHGVPHILDRQPARYKKGWFDEAWIQKALKGEIME